LNAEFPENTKNFKPKLRKAKRERRQEIGGTKREDEGGEATSTELASLNKVLEMQ